MELCFCFRIYYLFRCLALFPFALLYFYFVLCSSRSRRPLFKLCLLLLKRVPVPPPPDSLRDLHSPQNGSNPCSRPGNDL